MYHSPYLILSTNTTHTRRYGGRGALRGLATSLVLLVFLVLLFIMSEIVGFTAFLATVTSSMAAASGLVISLLAVCAAAAGPVHPRAQHARPALTPPRAALAQLTAGRVRPLSVSDSAEQLAVI